MQGLRIGAKIAPKERILWGFLCILSSERPNRQLKGGHIDMASITVTHNADTWQWEGREENGFRGYFSRPENLIAYAKEHELQVVAGKAIDGEKLMHLVAACVFAGVQMLGTDGEVLAGTPVPEANVTYITRAQLGRVLPEGWMVECQLNRYIACFGEQMAFPARKTLAAALVDIRGFLAASAMQATKELAESLVAEGQRFEDEKQVSLWSSDSPPAGAVDEVH